MEGGFPLHQVRALTAGLAVALLLGIAAIAQPGGAAAAGPEPDLTATLDGKPIPLRDVAKYDCDDFAYPEIRCWSSRVLADSRALAMTVLASVDYATVYDFTAYGGSFMNVSQNYPTLLTLGWSDKISSFKARNSENGLFWTDWFYTGTWYAFCCNTQVANLGTFSNSFSSMQRN
jgi:hypothetical protein